DLTVTGVQTCALPIWMAVGRLEPRNECEPHQVHGKEVWHQFTTRPSSEACRRRGFRLMKLGTLRPPLAHSGLILPAYSHTVSTEIGRASCRERVKHRV